MNINRSYFRLSDQIIAQHETALAQAVSKVIMRKDIAPSSIITCDSPFRQVGIFISTAIYVDKEFHSYVRTWADIDDISNIQTRWYQGTKPSLGMMEKI